MAPVRPVGLVWEGSFFVHHSLANGNCEMTVLLAGREDVDLGLIPFEQHRFGDEVDPRYRAISARLNRRPAQVEIHVRHRWPPSFERPEQGVLVVMQPWEYGSVPVAWVERIAATVDELWVPSRFVRDAYLRSGVAPEMVRVIPRGVNPDRFRPDVEPFPVGTEKPFRFLFVGGTLERKGFDLLLRAYAEEFTADDPVCLVVKDFFYGPNGRALVRELRRDRRAPEVRYGYGTMSPARLGGLYTACDCYVQPFRGEGFGLPIIEAMACGLPAIVTGRGPVLDYCSDETTYFVPAEEVPYPHEWPPELPTVVPATWFEPELGELRRLMRHVFEHREEARRRGERASEHVRRHYTWGRAVESIVGRLERLRDAA
jgi:glycosyltransferase involved in cell wall biosynthesis